MMRLRYHLQGLRRIEGDVRRKLNHHIDGICAGQLRIQAVACGNSLPLIRQPVAVEPAVLFLPANIARHLVGISIGIGSNR
jgi:hypothetical protein